MQRMSIRIEQYDGGEAIYLALDPDGVWASSDFPTELVTLDYNARGGLIGVEVIGSTAKTIAQALLGALVGDADPDLKTKLEPLMS